MQHWTAMDMCGAWSSYAGKSLYSGLNKAVCKSVMLNLQHSNLALKQPIMAKLGSAERPWTWLPGAMLKCRNDHVLEY